MVSITYPTSLQSGIGIGSSIRDEINMRGMEAGFTIQDDLYKSTDRFYARERERKLLGTLISIQSDYKGILSNGCKKP